MSKTFIISLAAAATLATSAPVLAQTDGALVGLHSLRREGGRICMADHFHYGSSSGHTSKKAALAAAMQSWSGFTALEYGNHWGSFNLAASKGVNCSQSSGGWGCSLEARPCRR